jgi:hypothetical protein
MEMPAPDLSIIARKARIAALLREVLPADAVIEDEAETRAYECDALTAYRCPPIAGRAAAVTTEEVSAVLRICHAEGVPVVPRGSGTSLAGGALPTADSVILACRAHERRDRNGLRQPLHPRADRPHEPERDRRGRGGRLLLRPRPLQRSLPVPSRAISR